MQVNLGCGLNKAQGWYNVDIWADSGADLVADAVTLNFPDNSVDMIYLGHVLHCMEIQDVVTCLENCYRILKDGGEMCAVGPDLDKVNEQSDPLLWEMLQKGSDENRSDPFITPKWECTQPRLFTLVRKSFPDAMRMTIAGVAQDFPLVSTVSWQCAVTVQKFSW